MKWPNQTIFDWCKQSSGAVLVIYFEYTMIKFCGVSVCLWRNGNQYTEKTIGYDSHVFLVANSFI